MQTNTTYSFLANPNIKQLERDKINVVMYHDNCFDGFGSAFVIWLYYKKNFGIELAKTIDFIPCYYASEQEKISEKIMEKIKNKNIIMCDFSYKANNMLELIEASNTFMILDHHKTAKNDLDQIPSCLKIFDMERSGVGITWDFFFENTPLPLFLCYIQDRDLWTNKLPNCQAFISYFYEQKFDFELWETFLDENKVNDSIIIGKNWEEYKSIIIEKSIRKTTYIIQKINNKLAIVLYVNSPEFKSDIGSKVFNKYPFGDFSVVWHYDLYRNQSMYSLRSTNERMDVSEIAQKFKGGGHRNASGLSFLELRGCLPFEIIDDNGVLEILNHKEVGRKNISNREVEYTLFRTNGVNAKWFENDFMELIKKKCSNSTYLVFQESSSEIDYNCTEGTCHALNQYYVFFNDFSIKDPELRLLYNISELTAHSHISFTSRQEFSDSQFFNK